METETNETGMALDGYRVLDLSEDGCMLGGRMLADLGADVVKIEVPGGSCSRKEPYYKDISHPEKSLFWFAYNLNKRGITLDIETIQGQDIFKKLIQSADILIESFEAGYMGQLGLDYEKLSEINPGLIMTSITPFGQSGPKSHCKASELTVWASGGYLYLCGKPESPPVWISFPQAYLFGGAEAAVGSLTALWDRHKTGLGQHVDVSMQECAVSPTFRALQQWDLYQFETTRTGMTNRHPITGVKFAGGVMKCKDGYVGLILLGGSDKSMLNSSRSLVHWMTEEGMADDWLKKFDWRKDYDSSKVTQDVVDRINDIVLKFIGTKTKAELYKASVEKGILISPVANAKDVCEDVQLQARKYWEEVFHPELDDSITYNGAYVKLSETPIRYTRRSPLIGEHNGEIYAGELGMSEESILGLKESEVI